MHDIKTFILILILFVLLLPGAVYSKAFSFKTAPQICEKNCAEWGVEKIEGELRPVIYAILKIRIRNNDATDEELKRREKIEGVHDRVENLYFIPYEEGNPDKTEGDHIGEIAYFNILSDRKIKCADVFDNQFGIEKGIDQKDEPILTAEDFNLRYNVVPYEDDRCILSSYKERINVEQYTGIVELFVPASS